MASAKTDNLQRKPTFRQRCTAAQSQTYCKNRFDTSGRMRKLNRLELEFAESVMALLGPGSSVLDAPCGSGRFFEIFSPAEQYTMLDYNPEMLKVISDRYGQNNNLKLVQGDIVDLPFEDGSFDLVFSMRLLHHVGGHELRRQILGQLARVSKRYVALSFYDKRSFRYFKRVALGKRPSGNSIALGQFVKTAQSVGLKLIRKAPKFSWVEQQRLLLFEKI